MVGLYLEDALPQNIMTGMGELVNKYGEEDSNNAVTEVYDKIFKRRVVELESTLQQFEVKEETTL